MNKKKIHKNRKNNGVVKQAAMLIIVMALLISTIVAIILVKNKKHITQVSSDDYMTTQNELDEQNTFIVNIIENEINDQKTNNETNESNQNNTIKESNNKNNTSQGTKYKLEVNCTSNVVNVYEQDENGDYTKCVKVMLCSVGSATPHSGTYSLKKYGGASWRWRALFGNVYGQYATQITGNILFHSVPYTKPNNSDLEYWEYDKLGTSASMGCVRLTVQNAKWIWDNCASGTKVKFYDDTNPGPLGKPTEAKISWNEECRNWDPTDPDPNNPWRNNNKRPEADKPQESNPSQGDNDLKESNKPAHGDNTENQTQESNSSQENNQTQEENTTKNPDTNQNTVNNNNIENNNNAGNNKDDNHSSDNTQTNEIKNKDNNINE